MTGRPSSRRSSQSSLSDNDTPPPKTPEPRFSVHSYPQERQIRKIADKIRKPLGTKDQRTGFVYVAKQTNDDFCKVGFSEKNAARRITDISKCQILTDSSYQIGSFAGAYRAERLIHCLLVDFRHLRRWCTCRCVNWEWYKLDYQEVIRQVLIVYSWLRQNPYDLNSDKPRLKPVWEDALERWEDTQNTDTPLGWNDFFITGPSMDVVSKGRWYDSSPQPLLSRQMRDVIDFMQLPQVMKTFQNVIDLVQRPRMKKLQNGFKRVKRHLTHRVPGDASASLVSSIRLPHSDEQSSPAFSEHWETVNEEPDPTPTKAPQSRLLRTRSHSFTARDAQAADDPLSASAAHSQQDAINDLVNESPSHSPQKPAVSALHSAVIEQCQQSSLVPTNQQNANDSTLNANDCTTGAFYHHQTTVSLGDVRTPSDDKGSPRQWEELCLRVRDIIAHTGVYPLVRGAVPEGEIKESSSAELDRNAVSELSDSLKELTVTKKAQEEEQLSRIDLDAIAVLSVDEDLAVPVLDEIPPVNDQIVADATTSFTERDRSNTTVVTTSHSDDVLSTQESGQLRASEPPSEVGSHSQHAKMSKLDDDCEPQRDANVALPESDMSGDTGTKLLPGVQKGDAAEQGKVAEADNPSTPTRSAPSQMDSDSCVNEESNTTGSFISDILSLLGDPLSNDMPLERHVLPSERLLVTPPTASEIETPLGSRAGCHSVIEDDAGTEGDSIDEDTDSSTSEDVRPWTKQQELKRERWLLCAERIEYEYGFPISEKYYEALPFEQLESWRQGQEAILTEEHNGERLENLRRELEDMERVSSKTELSTWDDWPDEPSEDDSVDDSWTTEDDAHASETEDDMGAGTQEHNVGIIYRDERPSPECVGDPSPAPDLDVAAPALTARETHRKGMEDIRPWSEFNPPVLNIHVPDFNPTQSPISSSATLSPTIEALSRILSDLAINPATNDVESINDTVPAIKPNPQQRSESGHDGEDMLAQEDDNKGRPCIWTAHPEPADIAAESTMGTNEPKVSNQVHQNGLRMENKATAEKRPMLRIMNEAHQWPSETPVSQTLNTGIHVRSPACVWGPYVELKSRGKPRETFREEDYLYQKWSF